MTNKINLEEPVSEPHQEIKLSLLRSRLLQAQQQLGDKQFPVFIIISGVDAAGKGDLVNRLNEWMDARYMRTIALGEASDEERERPDFWRFWRTFPADGTSAIFIGGWYSEILAQTVADERSRSHYEWQLTRICQLEEMLANDGALIIKCWLHLSREAQKEKLDKLFQNPDTKWRVTARDLMHVPYYDAFIMQAQRVLEDTHSELAPWLIVDGQNLETSSYIVGEHILNRLQQHLAESALSDKEDHSKTIGNKKNKSKNHLAKLDLSLALEKKNYKRQLAKYQEKANILVRHANELKKSSVLVFEGWDAAGKGGAIRRLTHSLDARKYRVIPIAAPTDEEKVHHYLWRFWRHMPRAGQVTIYDRSWYGRVLVERVEGFADEAEWRRAFQEINCFEQQIQEDGNCLIKFWLHIDRDEQLRRFQEREQKLYKQHKITEEDYRNRERWDDYEDAVNEMIEKTHSKQAPWVLVEANDKFYARIKVLKSFCKNMEKMLDKYHD